MAPVRTQGRAERSGDWNKRRALRQALPMDKQFSRRVPDSEALALAQGDARAKRIRRQAAGQIFRGLCLGVTGIHPGRPGIQTPCLFHCTSKACG